MPRKERGKQYVVGKLLAGTGASYIEVASTGKISQYGTQTASLVNLDVSTGACFGGAANYSAIDSGGNISQAGTACAAFKEVSIGSADTVAKLFCGSATASLGPLGAAGSENDTLTVNGASDNDKVFIMALSNLGSHIAIQSTACTSSNTITIRGYNHAGATCDIGSFTIHYLIIRDLA